LLEVRAVTSKNVAGARGIERREQRGSVRLREELPGMGKRSLSQIHFSDLQYSHAAEATQQRSLRHAS